MSSPRAYLYYPSSDVLSTAETLVPRSNLTSLAALAALCDSTPSCIGYNSNGWLKNGSLSLGPCAVDLYLLAPTPAPPPPLLLWPMPRSVSVGPSRLVVDSALEFAARTPSPVLAAAFDRFAALIFRHGAFPAEAAAAAAQRAGAAVLRKLVVDVADVMVPLDLGVDESYALSVPADGSAATLSSPTIWGALHGLQTLTQLVLFDFDALAYWLDAPVAVVDAPQFAWRGVMVDPARQFLPPATLRLIVDSLTVAKLNTLHVHILDCDSFPIEVASPFQTLWTGAFSPRERYTALELAGLVEFARVRGVRVIFEFDQPGHAGAMCVGHPELCPTPACDHAYGGDVLDPSSSATLPAMRAVVDALVAASVDSVLHLGGDEVSYACWLASPGVRAWMAAHNYTTGEEIYGWFVQESNDMAISRGKSPVRWQEVWNHFGTALDRRTIVHAWLSSAALFDAASHGYRTVFSVNDDYYLDYLGVQWDSVYAVNILRGLTNVSSLPFILGGQACAWGETMDAASVLSVIWPRAAAAAERLWSYNFGNSNATSWATITRFAQFRCGLLERGVPAPLPGAANAGDMRPAWTVGSCGGGYRALC